VESAHSRLIENELVLQPLRRDRCITVHYFLERLDRAALFSRANIKLGYLLAFEMKWGR
jgi:hypothetical protein